MMAWGVTLSPHAGRCSVWRAGAMDAVDLATAAGIQVRCTTPARLGARGPVQLRLGLMRAPPPPLPQISITLAVLLLFSWLRLHRFTRRFYAPKRWPPGLGWWTACSLGGRGLGQRTATGQG